MEIMYRSRSLGPLSRAKWTKAVALDHRQLRTSRLLFTAIANAVQFSGEQRIELSLRRKQQKDFVALEFHREDLD